uniref:Uncharacterized protein n=1 Tax=Pseudictyota dubia TaxID=2749911 RepID=A0A7R9ZAD0_9STRA|mmetsp:Transcript_363/g.438  ORF Transcript_363/g.438 Transcript_363/m.438 type:complete len:108 (+) Transcript_363:234-557(+)|eukprot:CAMPEP_0197438016 /NCGR_PEP_ID=MMETSP1175-20131217/5127_1 /TAXON_ID=1003142 /ORGANISM="Triceratium dubium, Strain CCMP147" /LENGTH=107 /DNA_ID=CAMNT_0042967667 /DNA_START=216 /DNA_END=539 /DNA_ORIENTATION=+
MTNFSAAADWLQNITGTSKPDVAPESEVAHNDMLVRDAQHMSELEAREKSKDQHRMSKRSDPVQRGNAPMSGYQQPKPKFVSHKTPKAQKMHDKKGSNRLGDQLHFA